jgi:hypothetical protein
VGWKLDQEGEREGIGGEEHAIAQYEVNLSKFLMMFA